LSDDDDNNTSMFTFSKPDMNNSLFNKPAINNINNINKSSSVVGFSFNNPIKNVNNINKMENSNDMIDINMENSNSNSQNSSMFQNPSFNNNINNLSKNKQSTVSFSFDQPQNNNNNNNKLVSFKSPFTFTQDNNKNTLSNKNSSNSNSLPNLSSTTEMNKKGTFTFNQNINSIDNNSKTSINDNNNSKKEGNNLIFNNIISQNDNNKLNIKIPSTGFNGSLKSTDLLDFTKKEKHKSEIKNLLSTNKPSISFGKVDKSNNNDLTKNNSITNKVTNINDISKSTTQEINDMSSIIANERIKKENQEKFMENDLKRKSLMRILLLHNHNIGIRPKQSLDKSIIKTMRMKKEIEKESNLFYKDLIQKSTKNIISNVIKEEVMTHSIYNKIISNITKEIITEEVMKSKKDENLLNNYYTALNLSTNDIINEVLLEDLNTILKSVYDKSLKEYKIKQLSLKKAQLKQQKQYFDKIVKYNHLKQVFSKWNHITKLKIDKKRINEEKLKMKKIKFDNTIKSIEISPGMNLLVKKNDDFIFKKEQNEIVSIYMYSNIYKILNFIKIKDKTLI